MSARPEFPRGSDLAELSVSTVESDEPGVVSVTAWANDGTTVTVSWDEVAASVTLATAGGTGHRLRIDREGIAKVSVAQDGGRVEFRIWSVTGPFNGLLAVDVGDNIEISDSILQS